MTLWCESLHVGAMSHFVLYQRNESERCAQEPSGRFGDEALQLMLERLAALGANPERCVAKVFGGGDMFPGMPVPGSRNIGQRNGKAARRLLRDCGIPVVSESLFGVGYRQMVFDISTGEVWVRLVAPAGIGIGGVPYHGSDQSPRR